MKLTEIKYCLEVFENVTHDNESLQEARNELMDLERLAEIGKAVEWMVNNSEFDVNYDLMHSCDGILLMVRAYRKAKGD